MSKKESHVGTVHSKKSLFLRVFVGDARDEDSGNEYVMCTSTNGSPMIESKKSGRTFTLNWGDIIALARQAGIDEDE